MLVNVVPISSPWPRSARQLSALPPCRCVPVLRAGRAQIPHPECGSTQLQFAVCPVGDSTTGRQREYPPSSRSMLPGPILPGRELHTLPSLPETRRTRRVLIENTELLGRWVPSRRKMGSVYFCQSVVVTLLGHGFLDAPFVNLLRLRPWGRKVAETRTEAIASQGRLPQPATVESPTCQQGISGGPGGGVNCEETFLDYTQVKAVNVADYPG